MNVLHDTYLLTIETVAFISIKYCGAGWAKYIFTANSFEINSVNIALFCVNLLINIFIKEVSLSASK